MSNLGDIGKELAKSDRSATELTGAVIGTIADFAGAASGVVGAVIDLVDLFVSNTDQVDAELQDIKSAIQKGFAGLQLQQEAADIIARLNSLDPPIAQAQTAVDQLKADLRQTPPVTNDYKLQQIQYCLDAMNQLDQDVRWLTVFADEVYPDVTNVTGGWQRSGMTPTANPDGTVFSDRYITPYFLKVFGMFLLVATAFDPEYRTNYAEPLKRFTARLETAYQISSAGIQYVRIPKLEDLGLDLSRPLYGYPLGGPLVGAWSQGYLYPSQAAHGAWHIYSGVYQVYLFPPIALPRGPPLPNYFYPQFLAKLAISNWNSWRTVYRLLGLDKIYDTITVLRRLTGEKDGPRINPGTTWTLRQIHHFFEENQNAFYREALAAFGPAPAARDTIRRLYAATLPQPLDPTVPIKMPGGALGLRQALKNLLKYTDLVSDWVGQA